MYVSFLRDSNLAALSLSYYLIIHVAIWAAVVSDDAWDFSLFSTTVGCRKIILSCFNFLQS